MKFIFPSLVTTYLLLFTINSYAMHSTALTFHDALPEDVTTKIIACCEPKDRNQLLNVNRYFRETASKKNHAILLHCPLLIGTTDRPFYMLYHCDEGNIAIVRNLLNNGIIVNNKNLLTMSPMELALQKGHYNIVDLLRQQNPNDKLLANSAISPFFITIYKGDLTRLQYLGTIGLREISMHDGFSYLDIATIKGHTDIVAWLLQNISPHCKKNSSNCTPLHYAAQMGFLTIVELLLPHFLQEINQKNNDGNTALHSAAAHNRREVAQVLINNGANVTKKNNEDNTPLHCAAHYNHTKFVKLLLDNKANANIVNKNHETALDIACRLHSGNTELINLLGSHTRLAPTITKPVEKECSVQ